MRILHFLAERGYSGGEVQLRYTLEHLQRRGHDNRLVLQPGARFAAVAEEFGIPVDEVRMRNSLDPLAWWQLGAAVRRHTPDLVHFTCSRSHKLGAVACRLAPRTARIVTRRMDYPQRWGGVSRWLYARGVDAAVVISEGVRAQLLRVRVPEERIHLIYEGIDPDHFGSLQDGRAAARQRLGLPADAVVVVCAASLTWRKGQVHLLRAFAQLAGRFPEARLVLAGDGPEREALEAARTELGMEDAVLLPGRIAAEDCLAVADVAAMPSLLEGLSVACLEAMATGLPVVASRVGGLPESVADGVTGLLTQPGDEAALAEALARFLADAELRHDMGAAGKVRAREKFSASEMAEKTEKLYVELVARVGRATVA